MCLQFATYIGKPANGIRYIYIYILLSVVLSFSVYCARARQEMDGLCFLLRFFYRKVQKSADRVYLNPVALEANIVQI